MECKFKRKYWNEAHALQGVKKKKRVWAKLKNEYGVYLCKECNHWHIFTKTKKDLTPKKEFI